MERRKDLSIQSLRGLAVLLVVAGHVIGDGPSRGMKVSDDSTWRLLYHAFEDLRVPLFTLISGVVYALRPVMPATLLTSFLRGKVRRLLVPLVTVGALLLLLQKAVPGTNADPLPVADAWRIVVYGFEHLWFLQAIFLIFIFVAVLDQRDALRTRRRWAAVLIAALILSVAVRLSADANVFSIGGALRLLPFFLLGVGVQRFPGLLDASTLRVVVPMFVVVYALRIALLTAGTDLSGVGQRALSISVGVTGLLCLYAARHRIRVRLLATLGGFAFTIYLLHPIAAAAGRIGLDRVLGVEADGVVFPLALAVGIGLPVVFELLFGRYEVVSRALLGVRAARTTSWPARRSPVRPEQA